MRWSRLAAGAAMAAMFVAWSEPSRTAAAEGPGDAAGAGAPRRVGLFVGSNARAGGREVLRHAEDDAVRMREVFVELGGMPGSDALVLTSPTSASLLEALAKLAARAREDASLGLLVFYYSGHADDRALLLGDSELPIAKLGEALSAIPARLRLELVDACRSGALTRRKGVRLGDPFTLTSAPLAEGRVVITSSAEWEDSLESDRLGGSFFTVHLASGLRGAADLDGDDRVTLEEGYGYVYGRTVESTQSAMAGPQHPSYRFDLRGRGDTVLTWPATKEPGEAAVLELSSGGDYLIVDSKTSRVVAEIRPRPSGERVVLSPGEYRVTRRTPSEVLEGTVRLSGGRRTAADPALSARVEHAHLVEKGAASIGHSLWIEGGVRGPLGQGLRPAPMLRASWSIALGWATLRPEVSAAASLWAPALLTPRLSYDLHELGAAIELRRSIDVSALTLGAGLVGGIVWLHQSEREAREPSRDAAGVLGGARLSAEVRAIGGLSMSLSAEVDSYTYPASDAVRGPITAGDLDTAFTYRALLGMGYEL